MFPKVKYIKEYPDLTITAEVPVIPIDDCPLLLVIVHDDHREILTPPVKVTDQSFPIIAKSLYDHYRNHPIDPCYMTVLAKLSKKMPS